MYMILFLYREPDNMSMEERLALVTSKCEHIPLVVSIVGRVCLPLLRLNHLCI
jgi:hypothetical protein